MIITLLKLHNIIQIMRALYQTPSGQQYMGQRWA